MSSEPMSAESVPDDLIDLALGVWPTAKNAASAGDGMAQVLAAVIPEIQRQERERRASFEVGKGVLVDGELRFEPADEYRCKQCGAMGARAQNFSPTLAELDAMVDRHECLPRFDSLAEPSPGPGPSAPTAPTGDTGATDEQ